MDVPPSGSGLPLTPADTARNRIWVSSWDLSLADEALAARQGDRYTRLRDSFRPRLETARGLGEIPAKADTGQLAAAAVAFVHGLVVQALFDLGRVPEDVQIAMVDDQGDPQRAHAFAGGLHRRVDLVPGVMAVRRDQMGESVPEPGRPGFSGPVSVPRAAVSGAVIVRMGVPIPLHGPHGGTRIRLRLQPSYTL